MTPWKYPRPHAPRASSVCGSCVRTERSLPRDVHGDFDGTPLLVDNVQVAGAREKMRPFLNAANKVMCALRALGVSRQVTPPHVKARMPKKQIQEASHGSWNVWRNPGPKTKG